MVDMQQALIKVAEAALEFDRFVTLRRKAQDNLSAAYADWKQDHGITDHIEAGSGLFDAMATGTAIDYGLLKSARRDERNARRRMENAILRYRRLQAAENPKLLLPSVENGGIV